MNALAQIAVKILCWPDFKDCKDCNGKLELAPKKIN